jgi:hypothetical protein
MVGRLLQGVCSLAGLLYQSNAKLGGIDMSNAL